MDNLTLRKFRDDDFDAFHVAMSDYDVVKMTSHWPWPPEPEFTRSRMVTPQAKSGQVSVIDLGGIYIGQVSVVSGELGYMLSKSHWGNGVVSWAVMEKLRCVFSETNIQIVTAGVWEGNPASEAVLEKFGFKKTASAAEFCKPQGKVLNGYSFELDREDWVLQQPLYIETDRLIILPFDATDGPEMAALMNDEEIAMMMSSIPHPFSVVQATEWIESRPFNRNGGFCAKITLKDGTMIGFLGLGGDPINTAYALGRKYWGKGFATEAMWAFLEDSIALHALEEVTAGAFMDNPASQNVLEKLGFKRDGQKLHKASGRLEEAPLILYRLHTANFGTS